MRISQLPHRLWQLWQNNSAHQWLIAGAVLAIVFLLLVGVRRLIVVRLGAIAERSENQLDDLVVALVDHTRWYFLFLVAAYVGSRYLEIRASTETALSDVWHLILLLQVGFWGNAAVNFLGKRYLDRRRAANTATGVATINALAVAGKITVWIIVLISVLGVFRIDVRTLITTLGVGGIALALAVQNILGDILAALAIVFDKPFDIGDFIVAGDVSGSVEHIGLKTTRLRSISGEQVIVANSELLKSRIHNYKRMYERRVVFTTDVTYDTPPDAMARIPGMIREIVTAQSPVRFDRSHFSAYTDWALRFETVYYVLDPDYGRYMDIQQNIYLALLRRFEAERIEFAFPTQTIQVQSPSPALGAAGALPARAQ